MIGKKVKWRSLQFDQNGKTVYREGIVVAEEGDWFVVKYSDPFHIPFIIKRGTEIELA